MATLESNFEKKAEAAILDEVEKDLNRRDGPVATAIARSEKRLRLYGEKYDVEPIIDSLEGPEIERRDGRIVVTWSFEHSAAGFFETGTSDHTIEGDPVVSFIWKDAPPEIREEFEDTFPRVFFSSTEVEGIDATHFTKFGLEELAHELESGEF